MVWKQTGDKPDELEVPPCPPSVGYVWNWFMQLQHRRSTNGFSSNPISYAEIAAWSSLMRIRPTRFEVELLVALDDAYFLHLKKKD